MQERSSGSASLVQGIVAHHGHVKAETINISMPQNTVMSRKGKPVKAFRNVEAPLDIFEGRQDLLKRLHEKLKQCLVQKSAMRRTVALVAMGGMGKTETARKLAHNYRKHYKNVAWIDAETESSARESFLKIAQQLNLVYSHDVSGKTLADLVYRHISKHVKKSTLFIFDNTNQLETEGNVFGIFDLE